MAESVRGLSSNTGHSGARNRSSDPGTSGQSGIVTMAKRSIRRPSRAGLVGGGSSRSPGLAGGQNRLEMATQDFSSLEIVLISSATVFAGRHEVETSFSRNIRDCSMRFPQISLAENLFRHSWR